MTAITRWVEYDVASTSTAGLGGTGGKGTPGKSIGTGTLGANQAQLDYKVDIGSSNKRLTLGIDGYAAPYIELASGTGLDPRFIAKNITEELHRISPSEPRWANARCVWENNHLVIYSGRLGAGSYVTVTSGTNSAHIDLGWDTKSEPNGTTDAVSDVTITTSGVYNGLFDELYHVVISRYPSVGAAVPTGTPFTGVITLGGVFNHTSDIEYQIRIGTSNGNIMGAGKDNCPLMSWISTGNADNSSADVEILYANYWYQVGTKGLMVKFSDGYFSDNNGTVTSWTIPCTAPAAADSSGNTTAAIGAARYIWGSSRGDDFSDVQGTLTSSTTPTELGSRGLYITFSGTNVLTRRDSFYVLASPPLPKSNGYGITNLSYGNVTVSTDSVVKCVMFEIMSGAVELSTVKFGLQSHGSFQHHYAGNADTEFRFGTVGPGAVGGVSPVDGLEWRVGVTPSDIARDVAIDSMHSSKQNLTVVSDADSSQDVGSSSDAGMCSDPIWLNIKLGNSEVGANSTINYRIYFDYS